MVTKREAIAVCGSAEVLATALGVAPSTVRGMHDNDPLHEAHLMRFVIVYPDKCAHTLHALAQAGHKMRLRCDAMRTRGDPFKQCARDPFGVDQLTRPGLDLGGDHSRLVLDALTGEGKC
jgi:hypothetical protein